MTSGWPLTPFGRTRIVSRNFFLRLQPDRRLNSPSNSNFWPKMTFDLEWPWPRPLYNHPGAEDCKWSKFDRDRCRGSRVIDWHTNIHTYIPWIIVRFHGSLFRSDQNTRMSNTYLGNCRLFKYTVCSHAPSACYVTAIVWEDSLPENCWSSSFENFPIKYLRQYSFSLVSSIIRLLFLLRKFMPKTILNPPVAPPIRGARRNFIR